MTEATGDVLALDVGEVRIGVARASLVARLSQPLTTLSNNAAVWQAINDLCREHQVQTVVVGLPRGLNGQETAQTASVRTFVDQLKTHCRLPIVWQDEALTSRKAEAELTARGRPYARADIDALAASYILDDYLQIESHGKI